MVVRVAGRDELADRRSIAIRSRSHDFRPRRAPEVAHVKTKLTQQSVFQSVEDRDGMVQSGMQEGSTESMDRLAELLAELLKEKGAR